MGDIIGPIFVIRARSKAQDLESSSRSKVFSKSFILSAIDEEPLPLIRKRGNQRGSLMIHPKRTLGGDNFTFGAKGLSLKVILVL